MAEKKKYVVWSFEEVKESLQRRFPGAPLGEILRILTETLILRAEEGRRAPPPYGPGAMTLTIEELTTQGLYKITALYEIFKEDQAVDLFDVGLVKLEEDL